MKVDRYTCVLNRAGRTFLRKIGEFSLPDGYERCNESSKVVDVAINILKLTELAEEELWMFAMTSKCKIIGVFKTSHGTANATIVGPREVFTRALLIGAVNIVVVHNHPSGDPTPSSDDFRATQRLSEVGQLLGVRLLDHIVVGSDGFYSFKEHDNV